MGLSGVKKMRVDTQKHVIKSWKITTRKNINILARAVFCDPIRTLVPVLTGCF